MIPVYQTDNAVDLALAEGLLVAQGISYFVHNRHFGSLYPGVQIGSFNTQTVMVVDERAAEAREILAEFLEEKADGERVITEE